MLRHLGAIALAFLGSIGLGMIAPMTVQLKLAFGDNYNPILPVLWSVAGGNVIAICLLFTTGFAPLKNWSWHWSGFVIGIAWPLGAVLIVKALSMAPEIASLLSATWATYPALVSLPILFFLYGEVISLQRLVFMVGAVVCVILAIRS